MAAASEADVAARLLERLLVDQAFRVQFRRDPAAACREAGLEQLAQEMALGAGKAMMTLDVRESKSSLAGVMMAAAMEGVGLYELSKNVLPHLDDVPPAVGDVLSRVDLPSVQGALAGEPAATNPAAVVNESDAAGNGAPSAAAAAPVATPSPGEVDEAPSKESSKGAKDAPEPAMPPEQAAAKAIADAESPAAKRRQAAEGAAAKIAEDAEDLPDANDLPDGPIRLAEPTSDGKPAAAAPPEAPQPPPAPAEPAATAPAEPAPARAAAPSAPVDPAQYGAEGTGTGGPPSPEGLALLKNDNVVLDEVGVADLKAGRIDPRVIAVLTKLSQEHEITVSCMCSDHSKFTTGGSISNHHYGRGLDIAAIDGVPVNASNFDAREIAMELQEFDPAMRPDEIGTPWAISGPGYFTDSGHQDHLHVGFKQEITADWKPPAELASPAATPGAPAVAAAVPGQPAPAAAAAQPKPGDSLAFAAVTPKEGAAAAASAAGSATPTPKPGDSLTFMPKVEAAQPQPAAAAAPPEAAAAASGPVTGPEAYPGDDAPREQLAAWMAKQAEKRGIPPELPVMAALVESNLQNLNYGDADSVGFFQMRTSIWNTGEYAGYAEDPQKQIDWFLDTAERVMADRKAAGLPIDDPNQYGEWIADVERPAEQYRGRYQTKLAEAQTLLKDATSQPAPAPAPAAPIAPPATPSVPADQAAPGAPPEDAVAEAVAGAAGAGPKALAAVEEAKKYLGTPYQWGGSTPETNFDCSGLVQWSYAQAGVQIPRVTYDQIEAPNGEEVDRNELLPGDLVFFSDAGDVHHVGMSLGGDKFIHAPRTGDVVKISSLNESYYAEQFAGGRRFDDPAGGAATPAQPAATPAPPPSIDPTDVAKAQAAVARDAAEVRRNDSLLFKAVTAQEAANHRATVQFLKAIDPEQAKAAAAAPPAPAVAVPPEAAAAAPAAPPPEAAAAPGPPPDLADVATDYPGDDASQQELAKWLAKQAEKAGLPPELPVMAALVESGVKNLNFGDADSVGFFQMRTSIWNTGEYAGYPDRPELQAKWFIDTALAVKKERIAAGDVNFGKDPSEFGLWIADVERPAEQYRGRYQLRLDEARKLLA